MLQRIQTIYLLIVIILCALNAFFPIINFASTSDAFYLTISGFYRIIADADSIKLEIPWTLSILLLVMPLITLITINLYKYYMLQIRLTLFNSLLMLGYYGMFFYFRYYFIAKYDCSAFFTWTIVIPAISIILNYLAIRAIGRDRALLKSLDRLR